MTNKELMHFIQLRRRQLENKIKQDQESKDKNDSTIYGLGQLIMLREIQDLIHSQYRSRLLQNVKVWLQRVSIVFDISKEFKPGGCITLMKQKWAALRGAQP